MNEEEIDKIVLDEITRKNVIVDEDNPKTLVMAVVDCDKDELKNFSDIDKEKKFTSLAEISSVKDLEGFLQAFAYTYKKKVVENGKS